MNNKYQQYFSSCCPSSNIFQCSKIVVYDSTASYMILLLFYSRFPWTSHVVISRSRVCCLSYIIFSILIYFCILQFISYRSFCSIINYEKLCWKNDLRDSVFSVLWHSYTSSFFLFLLLKKKPNIFGMISWQNINFSTNIKI